MSLARPSIACCVAAVLSLSAAGACRPAPQETGAVAAEADQSQALTIASFYRPVDDLSASERLQASLRSDTRDVLATASDPRQAPPRSPELYRSRLLRMPSEARLSFAVGVISQGQTPERRLVTFRVAIETEGETRQLYERSFQEPTSAWIEEDIDLGPFAGSEARLLFRIDAPDGLPDGLGPVWASPLVWTPQAKRGSPPNVVLISLDTLRADHLGCYGYARPTSPHIDRFAGDSLLFENAIAPSSWTLPSHASLFTGLQPSVHGAVHEGGGLARDAPTLARLVRGRGYRTAAFTGGGFVSASWGFSRGFERYVEREAPKENLARSLEFVRRAAGAPFFLFFHTYQIHAPYEPPEEYAARFVDPEHRGQVGSSFRATPPHAEIPRQRYIDLVEGLSAEDRQRVIDLYDGEIAYTDALVGDFLARLEEEGVWQDTVIVLLSDHGEELWDHGRYGHGLSLYEEQLRVPLIVKLAGASPPAGRIREQVALLDVYATIGEIVGGELFPGSESSSLLALATDQQGRSDGRRYVVSEVGFIDSSFQRIPERPVRWSVRSPVAKLVHNPGHEGVEFFRLDDDPRERRNLYPSRSAEAVPYAAVLEAARERFAALRSSVEEGSPPSLSDELRERLETLGYL